MSSSAETISPPEERERSLKRVVGSMLVLVVSALLLGATVAGFLARYLHPQDFWWAQVIAIGLPYLAVALALVTGLLLATRRWALSRTLRNVVIVLNVLLLILLLVRAGYPGRIFQQASPDEPSLGVVSFNLPNRLGRAERADSTSAFFTRLPADLVGLQDASLRSNSPERREGWRSVQVRTLIDSLDYTLALPEELPSTDGLRVGGVSSVPILVQEMSETLEVVNTDVFQIGNSADVEVASEVARAHVRWQGRDLAFYNIHLRSFSPERPWWAPRGSLLRLSTWKEMLRNYRVDFRKRAVDVAEIRNLIDAEALPVVISGDLNSTPNNWSYHALRGHLSDAIAQRGGWRWGRTYHADRPFVRIDVVFVDDAFEIDHAATRLVGFSDHRPVTARIRWRETDGSD